MHITKKKKEKEKKKDDTRKKVKRRKTNLNFITRIENILIVCYNYKRNKINSNEIKERGFWCMQKGYVLATPFCRRRWRPCLLLPFLKLGLSSSSIRFFPTFLFLGFFYIYIGVNRIWGSQALSHGHGVEVTPMLFPSVSKHQTAHPLQQNDTESLRQLQSEGIFFP
ncbi:hypothetical protein IC575_008918 [Cucumis melo]